MFKLVILVVLFNKCIIAESTRVLTTTGLIQGKLVTDDFFCSYYSYEGIPYAEPPLGDLRFRPPVPKKSWKGVLDGTKPGCVCPQPEEIYTYDQMSEDCLFLNIFTPVNKSLERFPVIVYVHPGDFSTVSGNAEDFLGPQLIIQNNIILVTLNFRLGALGFLSFDIEGATGNAAVKDVLLALKWINKNIERFGGNKNSITIMGHSSGAALAHLLLLTDKSTGLFHKAIILGGSVTSPRFLQRQSRETALQLCSELGFETFDSPRHLLQQLKETDVIAIIKAQENIARTDPKKGFRLYIPFALTIEIESSTAIITKEPLELIKEGIKQNIPIITGFNNQQGLEIFRILKNDPKRIIDRLNRNFELAIPSDIDYPSDLRKKLAKSIKEFYFNKTDINVVTTQQYINLITDIGYSYSIDSWIKLHKSRPDSAPVYYYIFLFDGDLNLFKIYEQIIYPGASRADDMGYTFVTKYTKSLFPSLDERNQQVIRRRMIFLNNFINYGNPTASSSEFIWGEAGIDRNHIMAYGIPYYIQGPPYPRRINFWYNVYEQYYKYIETTRDKK